jgi:hypothetical protein
MKAAPQRAQQSSRVPPEEAADASHFVNSLSMIAA